MSSAVASLLFLLPLFILPGNDDPSRLPQSVLLVVGVLALWVAQTWRASDGRSVRESLLLPSTGLLLWAILSASKATNGHATLRVSLLWSAAMLLFLLVRRAVSSAPAARQLLRAVFAAALLVSVAGLVQSLTGWNGLPEAYPPAGTLVNRSVAAAYVAMALPAGVGLLLSGSVIGGWFAAVALAVGSAYLVHAGCRAAWLAVMCQALLGGAALLHRPHRLAAFAARRGPLALGVSVLTLLASLTPAGSSTARQSWPSQFRATWRPVLLSLVGRPVTPEPAPAGVPLAPEERASRSVEIRLAVWRNSLAMIREEPLAGVGIGSFAVHYPRFGRAASADGTRLDQRVEAAHNDYLQLAAELGAVGVALFFWLAGATLLRLSSSLRRTRGEARILCMVCMLSLVGIGVNAAVSPTFDQPSLLAALAALLGVSLALEPALATGPEPQYSRRTAGRDLGLVAAAAAFVCALYWGCAEIVADRHVLAMARAEVSHDWPEVVRQGLAAREANRLRKDPLFATAAALLRLGRPAEAVPLLAELIDSDPNNANALGNLGIAHAAAGDVPHAARCFERVAALRPDDTFAQRRLVELRGEMARSDGGAWSERR